MHREAIRFIDRDKILVLEQNARLKQLLSFIVQLNRCFCTGCDRGNANTILRFQSIGLLNPTTVNPNFTFAENGINFLFGHAFQPAHQKIIDALAYIIFILNVDKGHAH